MDTTTKIKNLCYCQVLKSGDEMYEILTDMELHGTADEISEYEFIIKELERNGYHLEYNQVKDCYVIY